MKTTVARSLQFFLIALLLSFIAGASLPFDIHIFIFPLRTFVFAHPRMLASPFQFIALSLPWIIVIVAAALVAYAGNRLLQKNIWLLAGLFFLALGIAWPVGENIALISSVGWPVLLNFSLDLFVGSAYFVMTIMSLLQWGSSDIQVFFLSSVLIFLCFLYFNKNRAQHLKSL